MILYKIPHKQPGVLNLITLGVIFSTIILSAIISIRFASPKLAASEQTKFYKATSFFGPQYDRELNQQKNKVLLKAATIFLSINFLSWGIIWIVTLIFRVKEERTDVHGSARFASEGEIRDAGLLGRNGGIYLGAISLTTGTEYLRLAQLKNILLFAPSQSGKGVGCCIPNLLSWPHSVLVYDPKGENWAKTAGWRKEKLGSVTVKLDFTSADGSSAMFNPLLEIRIGEKEVRDAQNLASMIVNPEGKGLEDHWTKSAYNLLVGLIIHIIYAGKEKTLREVLHYITAPDKTLDETLEELIHCKHDPEFVRGWTDPLTGEKTATHPTVSSVAKELSNKSPEERSGIVSTALSYLGIFRDPIIARNTSHSDISIMDLTNHEKPVSLYIVVPESDRDRLRPLVRLILKLISSRLLERMEFDCTGRAKLKNKLMIILDEFARLRHLEFIEEDLAISLGYGINFLIIVQDISQIYKAYTKDEGITGNCHVRISFPPNKIQTAQELSAMSGVTTVIKYAKSFSGGFMSIFSKNVSEGIHELQRPLLTPDEILRMPSDDALIFVSNLPPIYAKRIKYYTDPIFDERSKIRAPSVCDKLPISFSSLGFPSSDGCVVSNEKIITEYSLTVIEDDDEQKDDFTL